MSVFRTAPTNSKFRVGGPENRSQGFFFLALIQNQLDFSLQAELKSLTTQLQHCPLRYRHGHLNLLFFLHGFTSVVTNQNNASKSNVPDSILKRQGNRSKQKIEDTKNLQILLALVLDYGCGRFNSPCHGLCSGN